MRTMRRQEIVAVINRTTRALEVMDDGIVLTIRPGYRRLPDGRIVGSDPHGQPEMEHMPLATANRAMQQNKARGTVNPDDPLDCTFLLGVHGRDETSFVQDNADPEAELFDRSFLPEAQRAERISTGIGKRRTRRDRSNGAGTGGVVLATEAGAIRYTGGDHAPGNEPYVAPDN